MPDSVAISEVLRKEGQKTDLLGNSPRNVQSDDASDEHFNDVSGEDKSYDCEMALGSNNTGSNVSSHSNQKDWPMVQPTLEEDCEMPLDCSSTGNNLSSRSDQKDYHMAQPTVEEDCEMEMGTDDTEVTPGCYTPTRQHTYEGELIDGEIGSAKESHQLSDSEMSDYSNESSFDQSNLHLLIPEVELKDGYSDGSSSHDECDQLVIGDGDKAKLNQQNSSINNEESDPKVKLNCPLCRRFFYNSKSLNSHVVKKHNTTLGPKFSCHICGASGGSRSSLKRHLKRTHKVTTFRQPELFTRKCSHCEAAFPSHMELYEHIRSSHQDELHKYFHCTSCPAVIRAKASFIRHLRRSHPGQEQAYQTKENCSLCEDIFTSKQALQRHVKQNHPDMLYPCVECDAVFKHNYLLTRHKMTHLADDDENKVKRVKKRYKISCDTCGRTYDSKKRLEKHIINTHTDPPPIQPPKIYPCRICSVVSFSAKQNRKHYRRIHLKQRLKVHCSQCNITFKTEKECAQHRVLHPTTCDICKKQFLRRDSLREHLMIHSDPRHQCPHCPKKFTQSSNLKRHIRVHTGEKPYTCPFCSRRFSDKSACNSHIRVHTGAERSVCEVCGASFSKKQRLNYHMKMHTGKGLIRCPICSRAHTNSYPLRKHVQSHCQPLTSALVSLGLNSLIQENPHLVIDSLNLLTEQALQQSIRDSKMNGGVEVKQEPDVSDFVPNVSESAEPLDLKMEKFEFDETKCLVDRYKTPAALSQLLKDVFKVQQVYSTPQEESVYVTTKPPIAQPELPNTFADELVKQCLEVIMKAEPRDAEQLESDDGSEAVDPLDLTPVICKEIPKIKITRKLDSQDKDGAVFVAEFIK